MKRIILIFLLGIFSLTAYQASAQARIAYVDSEYILSKLPEYRSAQKQLDEVANTWKQEMEKRKAEIEKLYKSYQAEWVLLPEDARKKREDEISQKEAELNTFRNEKFSPEGELFTKRQQLIRPIQDKVFDAIQKLAQESAIDIVLDKAGAVTMLYTNARYDRSDDVLDILGITVTNE